MNRRIIESTMLCLLLPWCAAIAEPLYTVVNNYQLGMTTPNAGISNAVSIPVLNDSGQVGYGRSNSSNFSASGSVHLRTGSADRTIGTWSVNLTNSPTGSTDGSISMNGVNQAIHSTYVWSSNERKYSKTYTADSTGNLSSVVLTGDTSNPTLLSSQAFNSAGQITYLNGTAIKLRAGSTTTTVANSNTDDYQPVINDAGTVAWGTTTGIMIDPAGPSGPMSILGSSLATIPSNYSNTILQYLSINESNEVAFEGNDHHFYVGTTVGAPRLIDGVLGSSIPDGDAISINESGAVAIGVANNSLNGLYFASANQSNAIMILQKGDAFDGSTIRTVKMSAASLNNDNQIAFSYTLTDGHFGVAVIQVVPEAPTIVLLLIGLIPFAVFTRRQQYSER